MLWRLRFGLLLLFVLVLSPRAFAQPVEIVQEVEWRSLVVEKIAALGGDLKWRPQGMTTDSYFRDGLSVAQAVIRPDGTLADLRLTQKSLLPAIDAEWLRLLRSLRLPPSPPVLGQEGQAFVAFADGSRFGRPVLKRLEDLKAWMIWRLAKPGLFRLPRELRETETVLQVKVRFTVDAAGALKDIGIFEPSDEPLINETVLKVFNTLKAPRSRGWIGQGRAFVVPVEFLPLMPAPPVPD
ncbi:hypothetical protein [Zavarzinia compransoris]|uniref:TonB C-terminal domain-containing protein n=1 Tax=Zavarzinia compransoris TaxID=1264899 RepID=A0A317E379_9PROT|nr:hypothetical protein [Zavarzinia compransoris]PWR19843.1 hypothetical protein DKG75_15415 [Zavarzinia compransoris]TDP45048.1 hypothetical protein DES42_106270 [Zavarzinia compransoris]